MAGETDILLKSGRFIDLDGKERSGVIVTWQMMEEYEADLSQDVTNILVKEGADGAKTIAQGVLSSPGSNPRVWETLTFFDRYDSDIKHVLGSEVINLIRARVCEFSTPELREWQIRSADAKRSSRRS